MKAIPKNTKRAQRILETAQKITCYSLRNNFIGEPLSDKPVVWGGEVRNNQYTELLPVSQAEFLRRELDGMHCKLTGENGHYCIAVHSNLWYEFESAA